MLQKTMLQKMFGRFQLCLLFTLFGTMAFGQQDEILNRLYGSGVHAYNRGDYRQAYDYLTAAIDSGNTDPRAHYFRGLSYLKLGRPEQAEREFTVAAKRELELGNVTPAVDGSLFLIQGPDRYALEGVRTEVQRVREQQRNRMNRKRFGEPVQARPDQPRPMESKKGDAAPLVTDPDQEKPKTKKQGDSTPTEAEEESLFDLDEETGEAPAKENKEDEQPERDPFDELLEEDNKGDSEDDPFN